MRPDAEDGLTARSVAGDKVPDRVVCDLEADAGELAFEEGDRPLVGVRVGVAADRLVARREVGP